MEHIAVSRYIIKIIGLLGEFDQKVDYKIFIDEGYKIDLGPTMGSCAPDNTKIQFLRDYFYPNFRKIMFLDDTDSGTYRLQKTNLPTVEFVYKYDESLFTNYSVNILNSEIYVFERYLGIFSLSLAFDENQIIDLNDFSNLLSIVRNFNSITNEGLEWHSWISKNILCNRLLRGPSVKADEYSGSKFKLYTVIDLKNNPVDRSHILFDLSTTSPLGSASGKTLMSPDPIYVNSLLNNKISIFQNWEALPLYDSFTCIGMNQLLKNWQYDSWNETYFRIYVYRVFFKYNLYLYNSAISLNIESPIKLRDKFEKFLNKYNLSHISFNFLANEIYRKSGNALELDSELHSFREIINNLSKTIQEEKQAKTNILLQAVTILTTISSLGPLIDFINQFKHYLNLPNYIFNTALLIFCILLSTGIIYFLFPNKLKLLWKKRKLR